MRISLALLFCALVESLLAQPSAADIEAWRLKHGLSNEAFSIAVMDLKEGSYVLQHRSDQGMTPASVQKLFSTSLALEQFGPNKRFSTNIYSTGSISDSVLIGDLIIVGGGDMSLGSRYFKDQNFQSNWLDSLRSKGIRQIQGNIICNRGIFDKDMLPGTWSEDDIGNYYGAGSHGLTVHDNLFELHFKTGKAGSEAELISVKPKLYDVELDGSVRSENIGYDNCYLYGKPYEMHRKMTGSLPANRSDFEVKGSLPFPEFQLANAFKDFLIDNGCAVSGEAMVQELPEMKPSQILFSYQGEKLEDLLYWTNLKSVNLFAEQLMMHVVRVNAGSFDYDIMDSEQKSALARFGIDTTGLRLYDGSGLSRTNKLKTQSLCELLYKMSKSPNFGVLLNSLPIAAQSGSLVSMFRGSPAAGKIRAKSGSFKGVRAYSGYMSRRGNDYCFAAIINDPNKSGGQMKRALEDLLLKFY